MIKILENGELISLRDIAEKLGVSERMVRKYAKDIKDAGIPIKGKTGPKGGLYIEKKPNINLNSESITTVNDDNYLENGQQDQHVLIIDDITEIEWQELDLQLENYDKEKQAYPIEEIPLLQFVLGEIGLNINNYKKIPSFIKMSNEFNKLALRYNHKVYKYMRK
jgi:biotin operon repressor